MKKITDKIEITPGRFARNRIVMPPMDTLMASDGFATDFHIQHYGSRAYGGTGTIIVESTAVSPEGKIREKDLGLWKDAQIAPLAKVVDIVHQGGAVVGVQLNHAGAKAELEIETIGVTNYFNYLNQTKLKMATKADLQRIENDFIDAAKRAKKAGFDFVELHAAHGYLLNELYHPLLNEIDKNSELIVRSQMIISIAKRIAEEVQITVGIRLSVEDDIDESPLKITDMKPLIEALNNFVSYFHISSGATIGIVDNAKLIKNAGTKLFRITYANEIAKWTDKKLIVVGNFQTRADIEIALKNDIDLVAIGREQIFNPNITINNLLSAQELDNNLYHWNNNIWWSPQNYKKLIEDLDKK
ncbi:NADH:flavin oxidoreductase/NADH oxidase [Spiroplasma sabaudiense Ar-1343]|uniref:NADH:flavin oxidoreductase/NADH oxidase n=1 Tax=Spiroplasma sabaudiense Ar-1343 TaxID=1276257 RepID=W6AAI9_9MOLU|nr:hypothetical protein [Spiroplasma sabaudiense]AHI54026.1 NADH:flavin oxidoreductase/NADH oxidase [Spiroplasma sabaudiense Ar-1343]